MTEQMMREEDLVHVTPTVLYRMHGDKHAAAVVEEAGEGRALIVFRSVEEAEKYRNATGKHPASEGWKPVALELEDLGNVIEMHECTHVVMPEPWTGEGGVDFFEADAFIGMLERSVSA
jgi:hypothetical protein